MGFRAMPEKLTRRLDGVRARVHIADMAKRRTEQGKADARKGAETRQNERSEGEGLTDEQIHERARTIARGLFRRNLELVGRKP